jgi:hypothetical protein
MTTKAMAMAMGTTMATATAVVSPLDNGGVDEEGGGETDGGSTNEDDDGDDDKEEEVGGGANYSTEDNCTDGRQGDEGVDVNKEDPFLLAMGGKALVREDYERMLLAGEDRQLTTRLDYETKFFILFIYNTIKLDILPLTTQDGEGGGVS